VELAAAGAGTARALAQTTPRAAILIGSFGLYPGRTAYEPGRVLVPTTVRALDSAVLAGRAAFAPPMPATVISHEGVSDALAEAATPAALRGALATTFAITTEDALAAELARATDCVGENLEALAVFAACESHGVPVSAVLGCTNQVGAEGRAQWRAHHGLAAETTTATLLAWLARGAPSLPPRVGK
jgi:nucleoside phosphorylase